ncbi:DUF4065 domain-containing protein [Porticoccaceae bacterium]|nr:DUF4065 domain-containing protein [Porticoccaceae bacterium]
MDNNISLQVTGSNSSLLAMLGYSSLQVGQKYLTLAADESKTLTPMQLIKLVYLAHGWMLATASRPLLRDSVEAWQYGPVLPDLYEKIKSCRSHPVIGPLSDDSDQLDELATIVIGEVYKLYGHLDGISLSALTHQEGTPWDITWKSRGKSGVISDDLIESHFRSLAAE